jgi:hypothetical protein
MSYMDPIEQLVHNSFGSKVRQELWQSTVVKQIVPGMVLSRIELKRLTSN